MSIHILFLAVFLAGSSGPEPKAVPARVDDLAAQAAEVLAKLPGVVRVKTVLSPARPTHRIIHLRDWPFVPKERFAPDTGKKDLEKRYAAFLSRFEDVQAEQEVLLRRLVKYHGLGKVLRGGLTPMGDLRFTTMTMLLKTVQDDANKRKKEETDPDWDVIIRPIQQDLLPFGAAGRVAASGAIRMLPLDEDEGAAKAVTAGGKPETGAARLQARDDARVQTALDSGPVSFVILDGALDLTESVKKLGKGRVEYIRVTTKKYRQASGEK